jgi:16S rRNA (cytidine1402-2'-O)-methyltransferase
MEDITSRALRILGEVDVLACEDTRKTKRLLTRHEITYPCRIISYHEHNERDAAAGILKLLQQGLDVGLCSNAGYPGVSDPGYRIIRAAVEHGIEVDVVPGAGAVHAALVLSGLPTSSYTFRGFLPRKSGARQNALAKERESEHTIILFESPYRCTALLRDALQVLGDREAAVCAELTKKFQRVYRGWLSELVAQSAKMKMKGEFTVVIAGNNKKFIRNDAGDTRDMCME